MTNILNLREKEFDVVEMTTFMDFLKLVGQFAAVLAFFGSIIAFTLFVGK